MIRIDLPYSDKQLTDFDKLLKFIDNSSSQISSYSKMKDEKILKSSEYNDVFKINKKYNLFSIFNNDTFHLEIEATIPLKIGMKKYVMKIAKRENEPRRNARIAIGISIILPIIIALGSKFVDSQTNISSNSSKPTLFTNERFIKTIVDSLGNDTVFIKKLSAKIRSRND